MDFFVMVKSKTNKNIKTKIIIENFFMIEYIYFKFEL